MAIAYAICPFCNKSIAVNNDLQENKCSFCGQSFSMQSLTENNLLIDIDHSNAEFNDAKLYFDNADFRGAGEHFEKSLKANPNNYLANYFCGLCAAYENEDKEDYNVPLSLIKTLITSIEKMDYSSVELNHKVAFLVAALNELFIIILSQYKKMLDRFNNPMHRKNFHRLGMAFLRAINELHAIDTEKLMVFDKSIASSLVGMTNLAVGACYDISTPHLDGLDNLVTLTDTDYNTLHGYYLNFIAYATKLDNSYSVKSYTVNYSDVQQNNKDILLLIDKYYTFNKDNIKKRLSIVGELLDNLNRQCYSSLYLTSHTCVRNIGVIKNDNIRISLINQAIAIGCERLLPRLYIDGEKRVNVVVGNLRDICVVTQLMDSLYASLPDNAKKNSGEILDAYYHDSYKTLEIYFDIVTKNYSKVINRLKKSRNEEYRYYRDFLFSLVLTSSTALTSVIKSTGRKSKHRRNLLKLCKKICEEFLLLCDYKIAAIEASPKFNDILKIYGAIDYDIEYLSKLK